MKSIPLILLTAALCGAADFTTGQAARAVLGQPTFSSQDSIAGTTMALTGVALSAGSAVYSYSAYSGPAPKVGDAVTFSGFATAGNNLTATLTAVSGGASGTVTVVATGQGNEIHTGFAASANTGSQTLLGGVSGIAYYNGQLFIADSNRVGASPNNNRVLVYNTSPIPSPTASIDPNSGRCPVCVGSASLVLGQPDFTTVGVNPAAANTFQQPTAVATDGRRLVVADTNFNRVLIWNNLPTTNGQGADLVLGQPDLTTTAQLGRDNNGIPISNEKSFRGPQGVWIQGDRLFVADTQNHRIMIWNSFPTTNGQAADMVLGFPDLKTNKQGLIPDPSDTSLLNPVSVTSDGARLFVSDLGNNRVLIWNDVNSLSNNKPANVVIGQPDFVSYTANNSSGLCTAEGTVLTLTGVAVATGTATYSYSSYTGTAPAVGQAMSFIGFTNAGNNVLAQIIAVSGGTSGTVQVTNTSQVNETGAGSGAAYPPRCAKTLNFPRYALSDGTRLFLSDGGNDRVLIYNTIPTTNGAAADIVLGQLDFANDQISSSDESTASAADSLRTPAALAWDGSNLFVSDPFNRRVVVYTPAQRKIPNTGVRNAASRNVYALGSITFGGTVKAGDEVTVTISGVDYKYKLLSDDTPSTIAQKVVDLINAGAGDPKAIALPNLSLNAILLTAREGGEGGNNVTYSTTLNPTTSTLTATTGGANLTGGQNAAKIGPFTLVTLLGDGLSDTTAAADLGANKLPYDLGNVQVYFDGIRAPLLYVSPGMINAQMPVEISDATSVSAWVRTVRTDGSVEVSTPIGVPIVSQNPGIFADEGTDPRPAMATHASSYAVGTIQIDGSIHASDIATITIEDRVYNYTIGAGDSLATVRDALIAIINSNGAERVVASAGGSFTRIRLTSKIEGPDGEGLTFAASASTSAQIVMTAISDRLCCSSVAGLAVNSDNPAIPGETISILATGLGLVKQDPARQAMITGTKYFGPPDSEPNEFVSSLVGGKTANVISAGLKPGTFGIYEVILELNSDLPTNPLTQVTIAQSFFVSNIVTIPIFNPKAP
jgi:uncharacterized protein (TIGR03437 family)